jgi:hypothetical protein
MDAFGEFFRAQGEILVTAGRTAGRLAEAAGAAAPAAAEAGAARTDLAALAGDVAKSGPGAAPHAAGLRKALDDLEEDAGAAAALDRAAIAADGGALETAVAPFLAECRGCAAALGSVVSDFGGGGAGAAAPAAGPCGRALDDAARLADDFARIRRFVGAAATLRDAIRKSARDAASAGESLGALGQELGRSSEPGLERIVASLNRAIDALAAAGRTYDSQVAPRIATLSPSLLQQLADNTDRLMTCHGRLQDLAGKRTKRLAPFPVQGPLADPGGLALARPIPRIRLGVLPPTKARGVP